MDQNRELITLNDALATGKGILRLGIDAINLETKFPCLPPPPNN